VAPAPVAARAPAAPRSGAPMAGPGAFAAAKQTTIPRVAAAAASAPASAPVRAPAPLAAKSKEELFDRSGPALGGQKAAMLNPTFIEGEHKVIVHTLEGQVKRGTIRD